jgi:hypothetical protein
MTSMAFHSYSIHTLTSFRVIPRRKHLEGPTYSPSQALRWARIPFEDREGFAKLARGYRIEWDGLIDNSAQNAEGVEGKRELCRWNARVCLQ